MLTSRFVDRRCDLFASLEAVPTGQKGSIADFILIFGAPNHLAMPKYGL